MSVRVINDEEHFQSELHSAGIRLVVVGYTAKWCNPCQKIAPLYEQFPAKFPQAVFLKLDVDNCQETAANQGVSILPTFMFYRNKSKIDRMQGADIVSLENKVTQHIGTGAASCGEDYGLGLMEINSFIQKNQCECLNESDAHPMVHCLTDTDNGGFLQSDCDEQLILSISFNQVVKIHSIRIKAPANLGPKDVKLFINQPRTIDFEMAEKFIAVQDLTFQPKDLEGAPIKLRYVKFQNVQNIQIFIRNNQGGGERTQIDYIGFIGTPLITTKMEEFKRVAGKKGESH